MACIVVFSGAGLSAESGIPTFRDALGLWEQHPIEDVATPGGWSRNRDLVLRFYAQRLEKLWSCQPNEGHHALVRLEERHDVHHITQNVDTLLETAGASNVWHLHGRIDQAKCEWHRSIPIRPRRKYSCTYLTTLSKPIAPGDTCPLCGGHLRPNVVWFEEAVDLRESDLQRLIATADVFIGVGTSAQVYPAAGLLQIFADTARKFFVDPHPAREALPGYDVRQGTAASILPRLVDDLLGA
jgi:NAD-dependent deacetylase